MLNRIVGILIGITSLLMLDLFALAQAPSLSIHIANEFRSVVVGSPNFTQKSGKWKLEMHVEGDILTLLRGADLGKSPIVGVGLFPGKWLPGRLTPSHKLEVNVNEEDFSALLPGMNKYIIEAPGGMYISGQFDASPLFAADRDMRMWAQFRQSPLKLPATATTVTDQSFKTVQDCTKTESAGLCSPIHCAGTMFRLESARAVQLSKGTGIAAKFQISTRSRKLYFLIGPTLSPDKSNGLPLRCSVHFQDGSFKFYPVYSSHSTVAEIDFGELVSVDHVRIELIAPESPLSIFGITALGELRPGTYSALSDRAQKFSATEPMSLFAFESTDFSGWQVQGTGWGITDSVGDIWLRKGSGRYFADSKAVGGEPAVGTATSPAFVIRGSKLSFLANGHGTKNYFQLCDATTGVELRRAPAPERTGPFTAIAWEVRDLQGRRVIFKAVDQETGQGFAWIAFDDIRLLP